MKKRILIVALLVILIIILMLTFPYLTNKNYQNNIIKELESKVHIKIDYLNEYNHYYIAKTQDEIIVYNTEYEEIYKENLDKIASLDYDIIYKSNNLIYEETIVSKNKVTYNYYDIYTKEKIDSIEIEG